MFSRYNRHTCFARFDRYGNSSAFLSFPYIESIPYREDDIYYTVEGGFVDRLDLIAYKFYEDSSYWWVIALASLIDDPFNVPKGKRLRIPSLVFVESLLS